MSPDRAVVTVQSTVRGCGARQLASRRLNARTVLRDACFGVANDLIDVYVREVCGKLPDVEKEACISDAKD